MDTKNVKIIPLNRVEGDLEIHLELKEHIVSEARSVGTMFRGFENLLLGRAPLDGLVITPRICGICSTAHLKAAAKALDMVFEVNVPDDAVRVRNITLMAEQLQNDIRHSFMLFMPDFTKPAYRDHPLYEEAIRRYRPLKGETAVHTIRETKKLLEIIAILGGQWPHSSFMVPGGVVSVPNSNDINQCLSLLGNFRRWYEQRVLGCTLDRWKAINSPEALDSWLDQKDEHQNGDLGFFIRFAREAGLEHLGKGRGNFISFGAFEMPQYTIVRGLAGGDTFFPAGFASNDTVYPFDQEKISEDLTHSHLMGDENPCHPFNGITRIENSGIEKGYSWSKAPRYDGYPAETGPLAEFVMASHPLFMGLMGTKGPNVFVRQLARLVRPAFVLQALECWLQEIGPTSEDFYRDNEPRENGRGYGLIQAHRGALGHWLELEEGKISRYQIITPSAWNASPGDSKGVRGPWEEALMETEIKDLQNPVEVEHIVRSFDPCLVCCVHMIQGPRHGLSLKIM